MFNADSRIFIAYEDAESFSAISKINSLPETMSRISNGEDAATVIFSAFWDEKSWGEAVSAVIKADVIIISLSGRINLPVPVQRWMDTWPHYKRSSHTTLVVLFEAEPTEGLRQSGLISYFQQIAETHGLDFQCSRAGAKPTSRDPHPLERADQMSEHYSEPEPAFNQHAVPTPVLASHSQA
jgi:hypothetical protein